MLRRVFLLALLAVLAWPVTASAARLSRADRAAIDHTLDVIVRDGVKRENPLAARPFLTADLAAGTKAQWKRGDIALYPYPAGGNFHGWTLAYHSPHKVGVNLLLQPEKRLRRKTGAIMFEVDLVQRGHRWLVANFNPAAIYTPEGQRPNITAENDLAPSGAAASGSRAKLGEIWLFVPLGVLGGGLVLGLMVLAVKWRADRRLA